MISIVSLVWNRPIRTALTLASTFFHLDKNKIDWRCVVVDQNSNQTTKYVLKLLASDNRVDIVQNEVNIGMAEGWKIGLSRAKSDYYLLLENDWFCSGAHQVLNSMKFLEENPSTWFVKIRSLRDIDNFGKYSPTHSPFNVKGFESLFKRIRLGLSEAFLVSSAGTDFTFNPIIISDQTKLWLTQRLGDDQKSSNPLRSGEGVIDAHWRSEQAYALVVDGIFWHTGFYGKRYWLTRFPLYVSHYLLSRFWFKVKSMNAARTASQE